MNLFKQWNANITPRHTPSALVCKRKVFLSIALLQKLHLKIFTVSELAQPLSSETAKFSFIAPKMRSSSLCSEGWEWAEFEAKNETQIVAVQSKKQLLPFKQASPALGVTNVAACKDSDYSNPGFPELSQAIFHGYFAVPSNLSLCEADDFSCV